MASKILDVVVIGGGISGIIFLKSAVAKKLRVVLLERQSGVGGKWRELPAWQDIQMRAADWSLNGVPIAGVRQPDIVENAQNWIDRYRLQEFVLLSTSVEKARWSGTHWVVETNRGEFLAKHLVVATGVLNKPHVPDIRKRDVDLMEFHSSEFADVSHLKNKRVVIVGGSHSAWDLLDHALSQGASEIHWVYRNPRWMIPSARPKHEGTNVRRLALGQFVVGSCEKLSELYREYLSEAYRKFGLEEIKPTNAFHLERHLLVGSRPGMVKNFSRIRRYHGVVDTIEGNRVTVLNRTIEADLVIYATGYRMAMDFLDLPTLDSVTAQEALGRRCKVRCQSLDYPNLFFVGPTGVESNIVSPLYAAIISKTIVSVIRGKAVFPDKVISHPIVHWDLIKELAAFDRSNYPFFWKIKFRFLAWFYAKFPNRQLRF